MSGAARRTSARLRLPVALESEPAVWASGIKRARSNDSGPDQVTPATFDFESALREVAGLADGTLLTFDQLVWLFGFRINEDGDTVSHPDIRCDLCLRPSTIGPISLCQFKEIRYCVIGREWDSLLGSIYQPPCLAWHRTPKINKEGCHPPPKGLIRCITDYGKELQNPAVLKPRHYKQIEEHDLNGGTGPCPGGPRASTSTYYDGGRIKRHRARKDTVVLRFKRPSLEEPHDEIERLERGDVSLHPLDPDHTQITNQIGPDRNDDEEVDRDSWIEGVADDLSRFDADGDGDEYIFEAIRSAADEFQAFNRDVCGQYMVPMFREFSRRDRIRAEQLAKAETRVASLERDLEVSKKDRKRARRQMKESGKEFKVLKAEADDIAREQLKLAIQTTELRESNESLKADSAKKDNETKRLGLLVEGHQMAQQDLKHTITRLTGDVKRLAGELEKSVSQCKSLQSEMEQKTDETERYKKEAKEAAVRLEEQRTFLETMQGGLAKFCSA